MTRARALDGQILVVSGFLKRTSVKVKAGPSLRWWGGVDCPHRVETPVLHPAGTPRPIRSKHAPVGLAAPILRDTPAYASVSLILFFGTTLIFTCIDARIERGIRERGG